MVKEKCVPALREKMLPQGSKAKGTACLNRARRGSWPNTPARKTVSMPQSSRPSANKRGQGLHVFQPAVPESVGRVYGRAPQVNISQPAGQGTVVTLEALYLLEGKRGCRGAEYVGHGEGRVEFLDGVIITMAKMLSILLHPAGMVIGGNM